jgi:3-hydroxymyristoyl/3-hydroxydecanoyl-(acyl carrier protein) dehydratase
MVPIIDFDDSDALKARFQLLCSEGACPGAFKGVPEPALEPVSDEHGQQVQTQLQVPPPETPFFGDHFPRKPVFPGTLLVHANLQTAGRLASSIPAGEGRTWIPRVVSDVKLRTFIPPGERLGLTARLLERTGATLVVAVESRSNQRLVGSAKIQFNAEVKA